MGDFYRVIDHSIDFLGSCEDGNIYRGSGSGRIKIGSYRDGDIFEEGNSFLPRKIGSYSDGKVYGTGSFRESIGAYDHTSIYIYSGATSYRTVGTYEGDGAEAAALLLLMRNELLSPVSDTTPAESLGVTPSNTEGVGSGFIAGLFALLSILLIPLSFIVIWWAIIQATGTSDIPFLIILVSSIVIGILMGIAVFKVNDLIRLYLTTVIIASIINIIAGFFTSPGYSIFLILLIPPIVVALASAIPTLLTYIAMKLIRNVKRKQ